MEVELRRYGQKGDRNIDRKRQHTDTLLLEARISWEQYLNVNYCLRENSLGFQVLTAECKKMAVAPRIYNPRVNNHNRSLRRYVYVNLSFSDHEKLLFDHRDRKLVYFHHATVLVLYKDFTIVIIEV
jgi:hypothetical protein